MRNGPEADRRMPAEWEPHAATWLAWPRNAADWPGKFGPIPWVYTEIVRLLARSEPVAIVVRGEKARRDAADRLDNAGIALDRVRFFEARTDRSWLRDTLPSFVVEGESSGTPRLSAVDWKFNAWSKYDDHRLDDRLARAVARDLGIARIKPTAEVGDATNRVVMEGGAIDVNGRGTLLATEECLLDPATQARNPGLGREGIERVFADALGIRRTIWLGRGIVGDDTHGHVDDCARFVGPSTVLAAVEPNPADPNHGPLADNLRRLRGSTDQDGRPLEVVELPMPRPVRFEGERLPASYANFYISNNVVLVPTFNDPADRVALSTIASAIPDREVVGVHCVDLVLGLGTLHCLTREQPALPVAGSDADAVAMDSPAEPG